MILKRWEGFHSASMMLCCKLFQRWQRTIRRWTRRVFSCRNCFKRTGCLLGSRLSSSGSFFYCMRIASKCWLKLIRFCIIWSKDYAIAMPHAVFFSFFRVLFLFRIIFICSCRHSSTTSVKISKSRLSLSSGNCSRWARLNETSLMFAGECDNLRIIVFNINYLRIWLLFWWRRIVCKDWEASCKRRKRKTLLSSCFNASVEIRQPWLYSASSATNITLWLSYSSSWHTGNASTNTNCARWCASPTWSSTPTSISYALTSGSQALQSMPTSAYSWLCRMASTTISFCRDCPLKWDLCPKSLLPSHSIDSQASS